MKIDHPKFETVLLSKHHLVYVSHPMKEFILQKHEFERLWISHPKEYHWMKIHGKVVQTPRWQQSYGKNYRYSGSKNNALPISDDLIPFLTFGQSHIDSRLNGMLLNWYDGNKGHYIGRHRDDTRDLESRSPIVTISLGQERTFRMRPYRGNGFRDLVLTNGQIIVIPSETNQHWTHEVPKFKKYSGRRISVTLRAFKD